MDATRFDGLARVLGGSTTRRQAVGLLAAAVGAGIGIAGPSGVGAKAKRGRGAACSSTTQCREADKGVRCRIGSDTGGPKTVCCGVKETSCRGDVENSCCEPLSCVQFGPNNPRGTCFEV